MPDLNRVILIGRLTADPELRQTTSGIAMCRFSIAIDRPYRSKDGGDRQTDFINVVTWRQSAEFVSRYFSKGKTIIVEGSLRNNNYADQNGVKHYSIDVLADNVTFGESKGNSGTGTQQAAQPTQTAQTQEPAYATDPAQSELGDLGDFEEILSDGEVPF